MKAKVGLLAVIFAGWPLGAGGAVEFAGCMWDSQSARFVLTDTETGAHSAWLAVGQSFQNVTIVDFDRKNEVLIVRRDSQTLRLSLQGAKTRDGAGAPGPNAIVVSMGGRSISVRDDPALFPALEEELRQAAAMTPQPTVVIQASGKTAMPVLQAVFELCKKCGLKKFSLSPQ